MSIALALELPLTGLRSYVEPLLIQIESPTFLRGVNHCFPRNALRFALSVSRSSLASDMQLIEEHLLLDMPDRLQLRERISGDVPDRIHPFLLGVVSLLRRGEVPGTKATALARVFDSRPETIAIAWPDEDQVKTAVDIVRRLLLEGINSDLSTRIKKFISKMERLADRPIISVILEAADRKGVPWVWQERLDLYQFGHGYRRQWGRATISGKMSSLGYHIARRKNATNNLLAAHAIPVPQQVLVSDLREAEAAAESISYPLVVKPAIGHKGIGVTVGVGNSSELAKAVASAKKSSNEVIIESLVPGSDVRLLVVNGRMIAAAMRSAPMIVGDGRSSIEDLVKRENAKRAESKGRALQIAIDAPLKSMLAKAGLTLADIPSEGTKVALRSVANWSQGGVATDVTAMVHPDNADMAVRAALAIGLDVAGIDFITPDISRPYYEVGGAICEVNYHPGLRVHLAANPDCRIELGDALINNMFTDKGRIPVILILDPVSDDLVAATTAAIKQSGREVRVANFASEGTHFVDAVRRHLEDIDCQALIIAAPCEAVLACGLGVDYCDLVLFSTPESRDQIAVRGLLSATGGRELLLDNNSASTCQNMQTAIMKLLALAPLTRHATEILVQPRTSRSIVWVANHFGIPVNEMVRWSGVPVQRLGHGASQARYRSARTGRTSYIATTIADDKRRTNYILRTQGLPAVHQHSVRSLPEALKVIQRIGYPVIVKPAGSSESRGVSGMISSKEELTKAIKRAARFDDRFIIEPFLTGIDHRFLIVNGKVVHVTRHDPAHVVGDGVLAISELIERENKNPMRGPARSQPYEMLSLNDDALRSLEMQGLLPSSVPRRGLRVLLSSINSLSTGATAVDVTSMAHPDNIAAAERAARLVGLDICGVDFLLPDVTRPYSETGGAILEVNQRPSFDMHDAATNWKNVVRETILRRMMAEPGDPVPVLRMTITDDAVTPRQAKQLSASLSEALGKTVGIVLPCGHGASIGGGWIPQLHGGPSSVVNGLLADQRLRVAIFLDQESGESVAPTEAIALPNKFDLSTASVDVIQAAIGSRIAINPLPTTVNGVAQPTRQAAPLRQLTLADESRFRAALEIERPSSWLYYFPFLFSFSQSRSRTLLWEDVGGSICVYLRRSVGGSDRLALYLPPFPFRPDALTAARNRIEEFNGVDGCRVVWMDQLYADQFIASGFELEQREEEFIYDTAQSVNAIGGEFSRLRQHLNRVRKLPSLSLSPYRQDDMGDCLNLLDLWYDQLTEEKDVKVSGYSYVRTCIKNASRFSSGSLEGLVARIDDRIVGVVFGGPIHSGMGSIFICLSDHHVEGLGYLLRHAFMSKHSELPFYNDSSDTGRSGLSHLKRQFRPVRMNALAQATI